MNTYVRYIDERQSFGTKSPLSKYNYSGHRMDASHESVCANWRCVPLAHSAACDCCVGCVEIPLGGLCRDPVGWFLASVSIYLTKDLLFNHQ